MAIRTVGSFVASAVLTAIAARGETLELTVSSVGATNTLAEALSAVGRTVDDLNGGAYAAYDLVKKGDGVLVFDSALPNFNGNITVAAGRAIAIHAASALGSSSGETRVKAGATLVCDNDGDALDLTTSGLVVLEGGTGYPGEGGQLVSASGTGTAGTNIRRSYPFEMRLEGDATWNFIYRAPKTQLIFEPAYVKSVDVGGHVLTVRCSNSSDIHVYIYGTAFSAATGGGLVADALKLHIGQFQTYVPFSGSGFFRVLNGGAINFNRTIRGVDWTYYASDTADGEIKMLKYDIGEYSKASEPVFYEQFLSGGMDMEADLGFGWRSLSTATWASVGVRGKVTGTGGFRPYSKSDSNHCGYALYLGNDDNDFSGGVKDLLESWLALGGIRAAGTGTLELKSSVLQLYCTENENGVYRLPTVELSGESLVRADGALNGFAAEVLTVKDGATVTVNSTIVRAAKVELGAGATLKLSNPKKDHAAFRKRFAGLYVGGKIDPSKPANFRIESLTKAPFVGTATNWVQRVPFPFNVPKDQWPLLASPEMAYQTASGFLWNDSDHDVEWTFCCALRARWELIVGENEPIKNQTVAAPGAMSPTIAKLTLKPGANALTFRMGNCYGSSYAGVQATEGLSNWPENYGLVYDPQGRNSTDGADYTAFSADEAQPLFTTVAEAPATDYAFGSIIGTGALDLDGGEIVVSNLADTVQLVNGSVRVADASPDTDLDLVAATYRLTAFADARRNVAGLYTGQSENKACYSLSAFQTDERHGRLYTNEVDGVVMSPVKFYMPYAHVYAQNGTYVSRYNTYDGYIWNDSSEVRHFHAVNSLYEYVEISIGGELVSEAREISLTAVSANDTVPVTFDFDLQPGPNRFTITAFDRFGGSQNYVFGNIATNGLSNWTDGHGLMYTTKTDTQDMRDYLPFTDAGDGMLFTRSLVGCPRYRSVSGVTGTVVNLNGAPWTFGTVSGPIAVTDGDLTVGTALMVVADDLSSGRHLTVDGSLSFSDSAKVGGAVGVKYPRNSEGFVIAEAASIIGMPTLDRAVFAPEKWTLRKTVLPNGKEGLLLISLRQGLLLLLR